MFMVTQAFAQIGGAAQPDSLMRLLVQVGYFLPLILIFYLLLLRPQQVQQKKLKQMLAALKKGDKVVTSGGIFGTIVGIDEQKAVLRIAEDVKVECLKSAIVSVVAEGSAR